MFDLKLIGQRCHVSRRVFGAVDHSIEFVSLIRRNRMQLGELISVEEIGREKRQEEFKERRSGSAKSAGI